MPIAIRVADKRDTEWMGTYFPVSKTDIAILERAKQILEEQGQRNPNGDRNCDDDMATSQFSVFCTFIVCCQQGAAVGHLRARVIWLRQASPRPQVPQEIRNGYFVLY